MGGNDLNFWAVMLPLILLKLAWAILLHYWPVTSAFLILIVATVASCGG